MNLVYSFRALQKPNYLLFVATDTVSSTGSWMHSLALSWLVYSLTSSPFMLGVVAVIPFLPVVPFSLLGGAVSDRYQRRSIIIVCEIAQIILVGSLAWLLFVDALQLWHIIIITFGLGTATAIEQPARFAFNKDLVGKADLSSAVSISIFAQNLARIIGPLIAGLVIAHYGIAQCFLLNMLSFLPLLISLLFLRPKNINQQELAESVSASIVSGIGYVLHTRLMRNLFILYAFSCFLLLPVVPLLPAFTSSVLQANAAQLGVLMAWAGIGAAAGAIIATILQTSAQDRSLAIFAVTTPFMLLVFSRANQFIPALIILFLASLCSMTLQVLINSMIQVKTEDRYYGRVISLAALTYAGMQRSGTLVIGGAAELVGISTALGAAAIMGSVIGIYTYVRMPHRHTATHSI
jgi:MFS family permease